MRKRFLLLLIGLFFCFPILVNAKDMVHISDVSIDEVEGGVEEVEKPSFEGLDLSLKLSFTSVNDSIRYKVIVTNDTNKDYELRNNDSLVDSDYILYQLDSDNDSNIVKAKSDKTMYLTARYMKEVDNQDFDDEGMFVEKKQMDIHLTNDNNTSNPNTGFPIVFIIVSMIAAVIGLCVAVSNRKYIKSKYGAFILILLLLPTVVYAIEEITIHINSEVQISKFSEFCYMSDPDSTEREYLPYIPGTIMRDYLAEHPDVRIIRFEYHEDKIPKDSLNHSLSVLSNGLYSSFDEIEEDETFNDFYTSLTVEEQNTFNNLALIYSDGTTYTFEDNKILDKSFGCYQYLYK